MQPWISDRTVGRFHDGTFNSALPKIARQGGANRPRAHDQNFRRLGENALLPLHINPLVFKC
jgi:hypothetical protein